MRMPFQTAFCKADALRPEPVSAIFEDAKELIRMTAQYNARQKRARKKAKENRKKDRVREAIAKSQEKKGRSQEG